MIQTLPQRASPVNLASFVPEVQSRCFHAPQERLTMTALPRRLAKSAQRERFAKVAQQPSMRASKEAGTTTEHLELFVNLAGGVRFVREGGLSEDGAKQERKMLTACRGLRAQYAQLVHIVLVVRLLKFSVLLENTIMTQILPPLVPHVQRAHFVPEAQRRQ
jgi:hypothetical protein